MTIKDRLYDILPWAAAAVLLALTVHLVSVLLMPLVAPRDAFARLRQIEASLEVNKKGVLLLPQAAPGEQLLPFEDPATAEGACLFDLSKGTLRVRAAVNGDDFVGVSLHEPSGAVFHALSDRAATKGVIEIVVGDARQIEELEADDEEGEVVQEVRVVSPSTKGFALIRALAQRPADVDTARALVAAASCKVEAE